MVKVFGGAALVIAGIAAFIEAHSHRPPKGGEWVPSLGGRTWWLSPLRARDAPGLTRAARFFTRALKDRAPVRCANTPQTAQPSFYEDRPLRSG